LRTPIIDRFVLSGNEENFVVKKQDSRTNAHILESKKRENFKSDIGHRSELPHSTKSNLLIKRNTSVSARPGILPRPSQPQNDFLAKKTALLATQPPNQTNASQLSSKRMSTIFNQIGNAERMVNVFNNIYSNNVWEPKNGGGTSNSWSFG
jgi:hypothetical protein